MLDGPSFEGLEWFFERVPQRGYCVLHTGWRPVDEVPLDKAISLQSPQTLCQRLLRDPAYFAS